MALAMNKILVANTVTNTTSSYLQTTTVAAVTSGNGTVITAGAYMINGQANITIVMYDGTSWGTMLGNGVGGYFLSDGTNVGAKALNANTTATLVTVNGGQAANSTFAS